MFGHKKPMVVATNYGGASCSVEEHDAKVASEAVERHIRHEQQHKLYEEEERRLDLKVAKERKRHKEWQRVRAERLEAVELAINAGAIGSQVILEAERIRAYLNRGEAK